MLPEYARIGEKVYKINTDFRIGLACFRAINDENLDDSLRGIVILSLLYGEEVEFSRDEIEEAIKKAILFLTCRTEETETSKTAKIEKKVMDFEYDKDYIFASFMSDYGINLHTIEYLHWFEFNALIQGLSENSIFAKVINLREMDLNEYKDVKTREKIKKAQERVKLPTEQIKVNDEELELLRSLGIDTDKLHI